MWLYIWSYGVGFCNISSNMLCLKFEPRSFVETIHYVDTIVLFKPMSTTCELNNEQISCDDMAQVYIR